MSTPPGARCPAGSWARPGKFGGRFPAVRRGAAGWLPLEREVAAARGRFRPAVLLCRRPAPSVAAVSLCRGEAALWGRPRPPPRLAVRGLRSAGRPPTRAWCGRVSPRGGGSRPLPPPGRSRAEGEEGGPGLPRVPSVVAGRSPAEAPCLEPASVGTGTRCWRLDLVRISSLVVPSETRRRYCRILTAPPFFILCFCFLESYRRSRGRLVSQTSSPHSGFRAEHWLREFTHCLFT